MPIPTQTQFLPRQDNNINIWGGLATALLNPFLGSVAQGAGRWISDQISPDPAAEFNRQQAEHLKLQNQSADLLAGQRYWAGEKQGIYDPGTTKQYFEMRGLPMPGEAILRANEGYRGGFAELGLAQQHMANAPQFAQRPGNFNDEMNPRPLTGPDGKPLPQSPSTAGANPFDSSSSQAADAIAGVAQAQRGGEFPTTTNPFISPGSDFQQPLYLPEDAIDPGAEKAGQAIRDREGAYNPPPNLSTGQPPTTRVINPNTDEGHAKITSMATQALRESEQRGIQEGPTVPGHPKFVPAKTEEELRNRVTPPPLPEDEPHLRAIATGGYLSEAQRVQQQQDANLVSQYANLARKVEENKDTGQSLELLTSYANQGYQVWKGAVNRVLSADPNLQESVIGQYLDEEGAIPGFVAYVKAQTGDTNPDVIAEAQKFTDGILSKVPGNIVKPYLKALMEGTGLDFKTGAVLFSNATDRINAEANAEVARKNADTQAGYLDIAKDKAPWENSYIQAQTAGIVLDTQQKRDMFDYAKRKAEADIKAVYAQVGVHTSQSNRENVATILAAEQWKLEKELMPVKLQMDMMSQDAQRAAQMLGAIQQIDGRIATIHQESAFASDEEKKAYKKELLALEKQRADTQKTVDVLNARIQANGEKDVLSQVQIAMENAGMQTDELSGFFGLDVLRGTYYQKTPTGNIITKPFRDSKGNMLHPKIVHYSMDLGRMFYEYQGGDKFMTPEEFAVLPVQDGDGHVMRMKDRVGNSSQFYAYYNVAHNEWKRTSTAAAADIPQAGLDATATTLGVGNQIYQQANRGAQIVEGVAGAEGAAPQGSPRPPQTGNPAPQQQRAPMMSQGRMRPAVWNLYQDMYKKGTITPGWQEYFNAHAQGAYSTPMPSGVTEAVRGVFQGTGTGLKAGVPAQRREDI